MGKPRQGGRKNVVLSTEGLNVNPANMPGAGLGIGMGSHSKTLVSSSEYSGNNKKPSVSKFLNFALIG